MKKCITILLTLSLALPIAIPVFAASGSMQNFEKKFDYEEPFADVAEGDWFAPHVIGAYEYGFVSSRSSGLFAPDDPISLAETLVIADQIHSIYYGNEIDRTPEGPWYTPYVKYAESSGIITEGTYSDYAARATRAQFAAILAKALPEEALEELADIAVIPDVPKSAAYAAPIYKLYNAGILSGSDEYGTFRPASNIKRCEVAVIALNLADESRRKAPELKVEEVTLYSDYGSSIKVTKADAAGYEALGWSTAPVSIPANASAETILNAATLNPMKTNDAELDVLIDRIFAQIIQPGMSTYQKVKACYDYLIANASYGGGSFSVPMRYTAFQDNLTTACAKNILQTSQGVCDDYSAAFMCMTRRIGLQSYTCACQAPNQSGGVSGHMVAFISVGGVNYIFDPQIEDYNAKGGSIPYRNFCKTFEAMAKTYTNADPAAAKALFGGFVLKAE